MIIYAFWDHVGHHYLSGFKTLYDASNFVENQINGLILNDGVKPELANPVIGKISQCKKERLANTVKIELLQETIAAYNELANRAFNRKYPIHTIQEVIVVE